METTERAGHPCRRGSRERPEGRVPRWTGFAGSSQPTAAGQAQGGSPRGSAPRRRADCRLTSADRHAHTDGLAKGTPLRANPPLIAKVAEAPRDRTADGTHAETGMAVKPPTGSRAPDRETVRTVIRPERRCRPDRDERRKRTPARSHMNPGSTRATIMASRVGTSTTKPARATPFSRRPTLAADHLHDDGQDRREDDDTQDECQIIVHERHVAQQRANQDEASTPEDGTRKQTPGIS